MEDSRKIHRNDVMPLLVEACPSFKTRWEDYSADADFEQDLVYIHLGEFARHLIGLWRDGRLEELRRPFEAVERLHVEGDHHVREAATIGLLEGLQNNAEHEGIDPEVFRPFLATESARWWDALNRFWSGQSPRVQVHDQ